jgi:hypothetical protein
VAAHHSPPCALPLAPKPPRAELLAWLPPPDRPLPIYPMPPDPWWQAVGSAGGASGWTDGGWQGPLVAPSVTAPKVANPLPMITSVIVLGRRI